MTWQPIISSSLRFEPFLCVQDYLAPVRLPARTRPRLAAVSLQRKLRARSTWAVADETALLIEAAGRTTRSRAASASLRKRCASQTLLAAARAAVQAVPGAARR